LLDKLNGNAALMKRTEPIQPAPLKRAKADRRLGPRKVINVRARISVSGDAPLDAQTADLSHHGVSINSLQQLNVGAECIIELGVSVPEMGDPPSLRAVVRYCAPVRAGTFRIGMEFTKVSIEAAELLAAVVG
jgi:hypothetical protein